MLSVRDLSRGKTLSGLIQELQRRNVFRIAAVYAVVGWLLLQLAVVLETTLLLPTWFDTLVTVLVLIGFPVALVLGWALEVTPDGVKATRTISGGDSVRAETGRKLDYVLITALGILVIVIIGDRLIPDKDTAIITTVEETTEEDKSISTETVEVEKSIAVLAFADLSPNKDQEYFSDGMAEEILNALVKVPELRVTGRTSSFSFKGKNVEMREIGKTLNVSHILEGSVRKQGNQVRITAQLIKADDGFHLWSENYDGTLDNIFELQDQISRAIAGELKVLLNVESLAPLVEELTANQEAYDLFLQGRVLTYRIWGEDTLTSAVNLLEQAVDLDPKFAEAWSMLALASYLLPQYLAVEDEGIYLEAAESAARKSIELKPKLHQGYSILGSLNLVRHDYTRGLELKGQAHNLAPNDAGENFTYGYSLSAVGRTREAIPLLERATRLDPTQGDMFLNLGIAKRNIGEMEAAERFARRSVDLGFGSAAFTVGELMSARGDIAGAVAYLNGIFENSGTISGQYQSREQWEQAVQALYGENEAARKLTLQDLRTYLQSPSPRVDAVIVISLYELGDLETFMKTFEKYTFANSSFALSRIWDDRDVSRQLRQHPDFAGFVERIGLLEAWQKFGWPDKCRPNVGTDGSSGQFSCD